MVRTHPDPPTSSQALRLGAIAQLGERLLCKQEVIGSIPIGSTSYQKATQNRESTMRDFAMPFASAVSVLEQLGRSKATSDNFMSGVTG